MITLLTMLIPVALKLFDWFITEKNANMAAKKKFLEFVEQMDKHRLQSVKLKQSYEKQLADLKKRIEEAHGTSGA